MLAWSEGTDNGRQKTRNSGYDVIVGGELFTDYLITPCKSLSRQTQNQTETGAGRYQLLPAGGYHRKQLGLKDFSEKSGRCGIAADWRCGALPMIDRGDIRQATDRCSNIWASLPE